MFHGKTLKNTWFPADFPLNHPNDQFIKNEGGASPGASRVASLRSKVSPLGMLKFFSSWNRMERDGTGSSMAILRVKNGD